MLSRRSRILLAVLVVASLTLLILDLRGGQGPLGSVRSAAATVFGSLERAAASVFSPVTGARDWWSTLRDQADQIQALREENDSLRSDVTTLAESKARADALDALLRVSGAGGYRFVPAEVIAVGPAQDFAWTVTIDAGRNDGIEPDMSVINGKGLVGRVSKTTATTATVVLVVDATSAVGGRIAGTEEIGIVSGTGRQDLLTFQLLDPLAQVRKGDALVTFGSKAGRPFSPGIPIGEVVSINGDAGQLTRVADVRPFIDVSRLSIVGVVTRPPRVDPRDSVLASSNSLLPTAAPNPAPLGGPEAEPTESPSGAVEQERPATPAPRPSRQKEQAATPSPDSGGG